MSIINHFFAVALILLMSLQLAGPQQKAKPSMASLQSGVKKEQIVATLERAIPRLLDEGMVPGLSIALIRKGELAWHRGFGVKNSQTKEPVVANTMFEAASLSKPVLAVAVHKRVCRGKGGLDNARRKVVPIQ